MPVVRNVSKAILPPRVYAVLRRVAYRRRIRGWPFPFVVDNPRTSQTLNCCVAYNKYGAYCVPVSGLHRPAPRYVLAGDVWEMPTIEFMSSRYPGGDIVHAGTYFGDFLPALSCLITEAAYVWAFEPNSESYRCARITMELNHLDNVHFMQAGLGEQSATRELVIADIAGIALGGASHIAPDNDSRRTRRERIQVVAIDDVVPETRTVSIIQLDVEGYEPRALAGALRTIRRCQPVLVLETLPDAGWIRQNLSPLGYRQQPSVSDNFVLSCA